MVGTIIGILIIIAAAIILVRNLFPQLFGSFGKKQSSSSKPDERGAACTECCSTCHGCPYAAGNEYISKGG